jgi:hypothetical protein
MKSAKLFAVLGSLVLGGTLIGAAPALAHDNGRDHWDGRTYHDYRGNGVRVDRHYSPNGLERQRTYNYPRGYDAPRRYGSWRYDPPRRYDNDRWWRSRWDRDHERWHGRHDRDWWRDNRDRDDYWWRHRDRDDRDYDRPWSRWWW